MQHDVFISYSTRDIAIADRVRDALEDAGVGCWIAPRDISPGLEWGAAIVHAIDNCRAMVLVFSAHADASPQILREVQRAVSKGVSILPLRIEDTQPTAGLAYFMDAVHWMDAIHPPFESHIPKLIDAVRALVNANAGAAPVQRLPVEPSAATSFKTPATAMVLPPLARRSAPPIVGKWTLPQKNASGARRLLTWGLPGALGILITCVALYASLWRQAKPAWPTKPPAAERSFTDCASGCPVMIIIPTGSFMRGSSEDEPQRSNEEGPQRQVTISQVFAAGKFAVTFDEWDLCVSLGGCSSYPSDAGWGRKLRPVINVSWDDAKAYVAWLSKHTGKTYRLLSEAEREYIARAGTTTAYWWGDRIDTTLANYDGTKRYGTEEPGLYRQQTISVNSFFPNPWGLYQVHGNVWEWAEDCYHDAYEGAPTDGSPRLSGDCTRRVLRGGSWGSQPRNLRSAARYRLKTDSRDRYYGFRIARVCDAACNL
jgi:formylglycine-generating enzyme required for sulfatase activity